LHAAIFGAAGTGKTLLAVGNVTGLFARQPELVDRL
jgi:hypothetical protein